MTGRKDKSVFDPVFSGSCFLIALGIINIFAITLFLSALSFFFSGHITQFHLPAAIAISLFINYLVAKNWLPDHAWFVFARTNIWIVSVLIISILVVTPIFDISLDGQWYHQEAVIQLARGWNPFHGNYPDNSQLNGSFWFNHYAKGIETFQACIYLLTGKIESAKATGMVLATGSFFLCLYFLDQLKILSKWKMIWISFLLAGSPLVIVQLFTFCNDGEMSSLLLYGVLICCLIVRANHGRYLVMLCSVILTIVNIKFTGILFIGCFTSGLLLILWIKKRKSFRIVFISAFFAGLLGVSILGFNPYVTNYRSEGNAFYPIMGKNKVDYMPGEYPVSWRPMNRFQKLFYSLFTHTDDLNLKVDPDPKIPLKIPFTFDKTDIHNSVNPEVTMAGFGALFSGILLLSTLIFGITIAKSISGDRRLYYVALVIMLTGTVMILQEAWTARYVPQLWFIPLIIAIGSEYVTSDVLRLLRSILYIAIAINISFFCLSFGWNYVQTKKLNAQLREIKANGKVIPVDFNYYASNRIRLEERKIPYQIIHINQRSDSAKFISFNYSFAKYLLPESQKCN